MRLEDTLNGGYQGVYNEVVVADCYELKKLNFVPKAIYDFGANVGVFTRFAREVFPDATIVAIEPDIENYQHLIAFTPHENINFMKAAIGQGKVYQRLGMERGCHFSYVNIDKNQEIKDASYALNEVLTIMPEDVINEPESIVKIDIEGNENIIFKNDKSIEALKSCRYICMELHIYSPNWTDQDRSLCLQVLNSFSDTHDIRITEREFFAIKKHIN